jgi:hypothetical protein
MMLMKRSFILFISLSLIVYCEREKTITDPEINEPTTIEGTISGILPLENSPYFVTANLIVDSQTELRIEPGVELLFRHDTYLSVYGTLNASGTSSQPIFFKRSSTDSAWRGIHVVDSRDSSYFKHVILEGVRIAWDDSLNFGAISVNSSKVIIENCVFRENYTQNGGGIAADNSTVRIENSLFLENDCLVFGGAFFALQCSTIFINNTVYRNNCNNVGGGLVIYGGYAGDIQNNIFYQNTGQQGDPRIYLTQTDSSQVRIAYNFLSGDSIQPGFISTTKPNQNFHLIPGSVCMDAGNPAPQFNDPDGSRNDQGAYGGAGGDW